jgi:iron complex outermembrane recepter protein
LFLDLLRAIQAVIITGQEIGGPGRRGILSPSTYHSIPLACLKPLLLPVLFALFTPLLTATGQEPSERVSEELELMKEEETVTIASRYEQPISEAPSNVYVITDEDIRQSGAIDLPTVLRRIPGMEVMQTTGSDFNVSVRGDNQLQANKLLVMVDGRSIYVDSQATVRWKMIPVTLPEIKRIEVLKGPASAVYGFNAFDGIINIITKSPSEMAGTTLQFGGGEFGTISSAAIHAGVQGKLGYRLSIGEDQNQQWQNRNALSFRAYKFNVHTEYALSSLARVLLTGGLVDSNRYDSPVTSVSISASTPAQGYVNVAYERPNFFIRSWWMGNYSSGSTPTHPLLAGFLQAGLDRNLNAMNTTRLDTYNFEAQHSLEIGSAHRLTYGVNYRHNAFSTNLISRFGKEDRLGLYLQEEWRLMPRLTAFASVRYDVDTFINPTLSPRVSLVYNAFEDHTFRLTASVAYRSPSIFETLLDVRTITTLPPPIPSPPPSSTQGSDSLHPEQIISYEAGYQGWLLKHRLRVRTDIFFNHISDLISFTGPQRGEADIYGGEAGVEFLVTSWLSGFANYSYQEIRQTFTGDARRGGPRSKFSGGLRGEWNNGLNGEVAYHYYGSASYPIGQAFFSFVPLGVPPPQTLVGSYNLLNIRAGYRFWQQRARAGYIRDAEVAVSAFNALNDRHKEHPLGDTIGSRVMGWLMVKF